MLKLYFYKVVPKIHDSDRVEISKLINMIAPERAKKEWAGLIELAAPKDRLSFSCIDYEDVEVVNVRDSHPIIVMDEFINWLGDALLSSRLSLLLSDASLFFKPSLTLDTGTSESTTYTTEKQWVYSIFCGIVLPE